MTLLTDNELNEILARVMKQARDRYDYRHLCDLQSMEAEIFERRAYMALLPCGHPAACIASDDKGTHYCRWCEDVARAQVEVAEPPPLVMPKKVLAAVKAERVVVPVREIVTFKISGGKEDIYICPECNLYRLSRTWVVCPLCESRLDWDAVPS